MSTSVSLMQAYLSETFSRAQRVADLPHSHSLHPTESVNPLHKLEEVYVHYIWVAIIGLIVGAIAKLIMPGRDPGGIIITMLLGIAGSFLGTFIGRALGMYRQGEAAGFIMSLIGAIILLAIYRVARGRSA